MFKKISSLTLCLLIFINLISITPINATIKVTEDYLLSEENEIEKSNYEWDYEIYELPKYITSVEHYAVKDDVFLLVTWGEEGKLVLFKTNDFKNFEKVMTLNGIFAIYNNNEYFFINNYDGILRSKDGTNWELVNNDEIFFENVLYDGEKFIATTRFYENGVKNTKILYSHDGINWQSYDFCFNNTNFTSLKYSNNKYFFVDYDIFLRKIYVYYSADLKNWQLFKEFNFHDNKWYMPINIIWDGEKYIIVTAGEILLSYDGLTWKNLLSDLNRSSFIMNFKEINSEYYMLADGGIFYSKDCLSWSRIEIFKNKISYLYDYFKYIFPYNDKLVVLGLENIVVLEKKEFIQRQGQVIKNFDIGSGEILDYTTSPTGIEVTVGITGYIAININKTNWITVHTNTEENINSVIWFKDKFVAVGNKGVILYSYDGIEWVKVDSLFKSNFSTIVSNDEYLIALGRDGTILKSYDGINWSVEKIGISQRIEKAIWSNDKFIAIGNPWYSEIFLSKDGIEWEKVGSFVEYLTDIVWNGNLYIASSENGNFLISKDGRDWEVVKVDELSIFTTVIWDGEKFVANSNDFWRGGGITSYISYNGYNWEKIYSENMPSNAYRLFYNNGIYTVAAFGYLYQSNDLKNWSASIIPNVYRKVAYRDSEDGVKYVAVGGQNFWGYERSSQNIYVSYDGITWSSVNSGTTNAFFDVIWDGENFIAVGQYGMIYKSIDGITWNPGFTNILVNRSIAFGNGRYLIIGNTMTEFLILTSLDAENWTEVKTNIPEILKIKNLSEKIWFEKLYYSEDRFYLFGYMHDEFENHQVRFVLESFDGKNWSIVISYPAIIDSETATYKEALKEVVKINGETYVVTDIRVMKLIDDNLETIFEIPKRYFNYINTMVWTGEEYLVGGSFLHSSKNGVDWKKEYNFNIYHGISDILSGKESDILISFYSLFTRPKDNGGNYLKIAGEDHIKIPEKDFVFLQYYSYLIDEKNDVQIYSDVVWELDKEYNGITIDRKTGKLTVNSTAKENKIIIIAKDLNLGIETKKVVFVGYTGLTLPSKINPYEGRNKEDLITLGDQGIERINEYRNKLGLVELKYNESLTYAAQSHSNYLKYNNKDGHYQSPNDPKFTGITPFDRANYYGYYGSVGEGIVNGLENVVKAIDELMDAPYHRLSIIDPNYTEVGVGYEGGITTAVYGTKNQVLNDSVVVYPYNGQIDAKTSWFVNEIPNPLRFYDKDKIYVGYPISMSIHDFNTKELKTVSVSLKDEKGTDIPFYLIDSSKETEFKKHVFIIPKEPLKPETQYTVNVSAIKVNNDLTEVPIEKGWTFTTRKVGITLNKTEKTIKIGGSFYLVAEETSKDGKNRGILWTSSNEAVAKVDSTGKVTAVGVGTGTITVKTVDGGYTATCEVTVEPEEFIGSRKATTIKEELETKGKIKISELTGEKLPVDVTLTNEALKEALKEVSANAKIEVEIKEYEKTAQTLGSLKSLSNIYQFKLKVDDQIVGNFEEKIEMEFKYDPTNVNNKENLGVYWYDPDKKVWVEIESKLGDNNTIIGLTNHWSKFAVFEKEAVYRLAGNSRITTAIEISKEGWPQGSKYAIITNGWEFADALAGSTFAYLKDAPILLTRPRSLPNEVKEELTRLGVEKVYILGGNAAVSVDVENALKDLGYKTVRISGSNRFETAIKIGEEIRKEKAVDTIILATSHNYPDALAIGPVAAQKGIPILFTRPTILNAQTKEAIENWGIKKVIIVGGNAAVTNSIEEELKTMGLEVERLAGSNRYQTAITIAKHFDTGEYTGVKIATGLDFADALAGSVLAAKQGMPIILSRKDVLLQVVEEHLKERNYSKIAVLGGNAAISEEIFKKLKEIIKE